MAPPTMASDEQLKEARVACEQASKNGVVRSWQIKDELAKKGIYMDESTIRGRFIQMGHPLGSVATALATPNVAMGSGGGLAVSEPAKPGEAEEEETPAKPGVAALASGLPATEPEPATVYPPELQAYIPTEEDVNGYVEREIDKRLATHYQLGKHPITQGKQGTGKTFSHLHYAFKHRLPFMLVSCFEDLVLHKFFGDKSIKDGTVVFKEGILTKMIQYPCVILFDEINAVSNAKSFDFHALLQNRELFVKDAADGEGKTYKLHKKCRIGFAQNPRSAKYIGGTVKPSSFLGRCTYITFPDFEKDEIVSILIKRFPSLEKQKLMEFVDFFVEANNFMMTNGIAVDISIRQLINMVDFYAGGMKLEHAIDDGLASILDSISQPQHKKALMGVATTIFGDLAENQPTQSEDRLEKMKQQLAAQIKAGTIAVASTQTPKP